MADTLVNLLAGAAVVLLAAGVGHALIDLLGPRGSGGAQRVLFSLALGVMALGLLTLGLGHAGLLHRWLFRLLAAAGLAAVGPRLWRMGRQLAGLRLGRRFLGCTLLEKVLIVMIAAQAGAMLLSALAPPVGADALAYHLAVPKTYIDGHSIVNLPNHKHAAQPFLLEMIFTLSMLLKSDVAAQVVNVALTCAAGAAVFLLARMFCSRMVGVTAAAAFMLTPQLLGSAELLGPESAMALLTVLTFAGLAHWARAGRDSRTRWLVAVSLLCAGAAGLKQSGAGHVLLVAPAVLAVPVLAFGGGLRASARSAAVYGAITLVLGFGWYARCFAMSGNPLHPYGSPAAFGEAFAGRDEMGKSLAGLLAYPWDVTMRASDFGTLVTDNPGPLPLAFVPLLLLVLGPVPRPVKLMLLYSAAYAAAIFFTSQLARYLVPILGFTSIAAALAIERLSGLGRAARVFARGALVLACVTQVGLSARAVASDGGNRLGVVFGGKSRAEFLSRALYTYRGFDYLNRHSPPGSRVLLLYGHEPYYLHRPYVIAGFALVGSPLGEEDYASEEAFARAVRRLGASYVYVDEYVRTLFFARRIAHHPEVVAVQESFLSRRCAMVFRERTRRGSLVRIYRVIDDPGAGRREIDYAEA